MKNRKGKDYRLGDLIVALFEEANKISSQPEEVKIMVYAALKDLLTRRIASRHHIVFQLS
jgi:hypothetical protein